MYKELDNDQRRQFAEALQVYEAYLAAREERSRGYEGSMRWKKVGDKEYLVRSDGRGRDRSLGPRSSDAERTLARFKERRKILDDQISGLAARLEKIARINRALLLGRVPAVVARIVRKLDDTKLLGRNVTVAGTNALYAYEAKAGVHVSGEYLATGDVDLLWDTKSSLKLALKDISRHGIIGLLRRVDRSFGTTRQQPYRAVNRDGYMVDLIKAEPSPPWKADEPVRLGGEGDLVAAPIPGLQWLISSPKLSQVAIGDDGRPVRMVVPDPRTFALHKLWLSGQKDRDPVKRRRDRDQASTVVKILDEFLPMLPFEGEYLQELPASLRKRVEELRRMP